MKKIFLLFCFSMGALLVSAQPVNLMTAQSQIQTLYSNSFENGPDDLIKYIHTMSETRKTNGEPYLVYWYSYANYWLSQYYVRMGPATEVKAKGALSIAIENLEQKKDKNAEDYVLLAVLINYSVKFNPGKAVVISSKANEYLEKAKKIDDKNPRIYVAIARSDFYKPVEWGGGKIAEANLLKALSLKDKNEHPFAPSWGRLMAYELIVSLYLRENRKEDARVYASRGLKEFPNNRSLMDQLKDAE